MIVLCGNCRAPVKMDGQLPNPPGLAAVLPCQAQTGAAQEWLPRGRTSSVKIASAAKSLKLAASHLSAASFASGPAGSPPRRLRTPFSRLLLLTSSDTKRAHKRLGWVPPMTTLSNCHRLKPAQTEETHIRRNNTVTSSKVTGSPFEGL
jgi:hypothetical protein